MTGSAAGVVAITGAAGFVGSLLSERFASAGWSVIPLSRDAANQRSAAVAFNLGDDLDPNVFRSRGATALVHCAYDFRPRSWSEIHRTNVVGSRKLFTAAHAGGVERVVAISTISAFPGCRSMYGRAKLNVEAAATEIGGHIVRPGLVFIDEWTRAGGMFGALTTSARARIVPLIDGGRHCQYLIHIDDLFGLLVRICAGDVEVHTPITAAGPRCWPMRRLLEQVARRQGSAPQFVSVPWQAVWLGLKAAELVRVPVGYRSDSVISLVNQDPHPDFSTLRNLGVTAREFSVD